MPTTVAVPDIGTIEFPDSMDKAAIVRAIKQLQVKRAQPQLQALEKAHQLQALEKAQEAGRQNDADNAGFTTALGRAAGIGSLSPNSSLAQIAGVVSGAPFSIASTALKEAVPEEFKQKLMSKPGIVGTIPAAYDFAADILPMLAPMNAGSKALNASRVGKYFWKVIGGAFGLKAAKDLPESARKAGQAWGNPKLTLGQKLAATEPALAEMGIGAMGLSHAALPEVTPAEQLARAIQKSPLLGESLAKKYQNILPQTAKAVVDQEVKKGEKTVASEVKRSVESEHAETRNKNELQTGTSAIATSGGSSKQMESEQSASINWLNAVAGNDTKAINDAAAAMLREQTGTSQQSEVKPSVLDNPNLERTEIRTSGSDVSKTGAPIAQVGAHPPQERQRVGQQFGQLGIDDPLSALARTWSQAPKTSIGEAARRTMVKTLQGLRELQNPSTQARGAGTLRKVLLEDVKQLSPHEQDQLKRSIYASLKIGIAKKVSQLEVRPPVGETPPLRQSGKAAEVQEPRQENPPQTPITKGQNETQETSAKTVPEKEVRPAEPGAVAAIPGVRPQDVQNAGEAKVNAPAPAPAEPAQVQAGGKNEPVAPPANAPTKPTPEPTGSAVQPAAEKAPAKGPGIISMGGLAPGDPNEPVGKGIPSQTEGYGEDIYGVAQRVREARAKSGQVAPVPSGEGVGNEEAVQWGRDLLAAGANPEKTLQDFEKTKAISFDAMALTRAHGEELAKAARNIEGKFGTESPEYKIAKKALDDWDARTKPMGTVWHKSGMAMQGETDLDTGSFTGLSREFKNQTGKDFTPAQAKEAKKIASANVKGQEELEAAKQKLFEEAQKPIDPKVKGIVERILAFSKTQSDAARLRIASRRGRLSAGLDPQELADYAIIGADHILNGTISLGEWSAKMIGEFGESLRPYLREIFDASDKEADKITAQQAGPQAPAVKAARSPAPTNIDDIRKVMSGHKPGTAFTPEQVKTLWGRAKTYLDQGIDNFDDIRNKLATDLGLPVQEVTRGLTQSQTIKRLADDVWKKQTARRRLHQQAVLWLKGAELPGYRKAINAVPRALFSLKVGFHGTVALGTHAPAVAFQPNYWATYARDFGKMYKMVANPAYYEMQVQDLLRRPNFIKARRAGLVNDPYQLEEYSNPDAPQYLSPKLAKAFDTLTTMGNRGYSVLKILRQDMFDQQWESLPESMQTPEVAKSIADGVNHATGVVQAKPFKGANVAFFAPKLEMSRAAWLVSDPVKAADIFARWGKATDAEKQFAIRQVKEKATVVGTLMGMLALNQGILTMTGSKQKINFTDPMKGDFLKFKAAGMDFSYGNSLLTMARLPVRMYAIRRGNGGKLKNLIYPDEDTYDVMGEYARSQLSPFASLAADLWLRSDWMRRQLPNSNRPMPKRLVKEGIKPYTWPEFWSEEVLPIPAEEAAREVWKGQGMNADEIRNAKKAMATIAVMSATGARMTDDWDLKKSK